MATIEELQTALRNAHEAGDTEAAGRFASMIASRTITPQSAPLTSTVGELARQVGLTVRHGVEGLGGTADIFAAPFRYALSKAGVQTPTLAYAGKQLSDAINLPSPQTPDERVVAEATKMMAGGAGLAKAASVVANASNVPAWASRTGEIFAANPTAQMTSAAGGGLAGGVAKEYDVGPAGQVGASVVGTVLGGLAPSAAQSAANTARTLWDKVRPTDIDVQLTTILGRAGVNFAELGAGVQNQLRDATRAMLAAGKQVDPAALARLADFRAHGVTPTRGMLTLDPVQITREQNLSKIGVNTGDVNAQGLGQLYNANNARLIDRMQTMGAATGDPLAAGQLVSSSILARQQSLRGAEQAAWDAARSSPGYTQPISAHVLSDVNRALGETGMMPFMNPTISRYIEAFQNGQPFTPQAYRNLMSMLSNEAASGGNQAAAAKIAKNVLERADLRPPGFAGVTNQPVTAQTAAAMRGADQAAQEAIAAVNSARQATRAAYAYEESSPLVRAALSGGSSSDPKRIAQRFVINGTPEEARDVANQVGPEGIRTIRDALMKHIFDKATNDSSVEVGKVSQSALNKAIKNFGVEKLRLFFDAEELASLQSLGRVASYTQVQPVGSAVNNSNSGALLLGKGYDALQWLARRFPFGESLIANPANNIATGVLTRRARNIPAGLLVPTPQAASPALLTAPIVGGGLLGGGLLAQPVLE